jgi:pyruvate formate lyase activating enzyme
MRITGLQRTTLLDYPGKIAATVFLGGCNFQCPYCHNASLVNITDRTPEIREEEFFSFLDRRRGQLDGVCVSGGEPLLQADLEPFLERIKALGFLVKLDTNGSFPKKLRALVDGGLADAVAMDVKNAPDKYAATAGVNRDVLPGVRESVAYLLSGPVAYEFRTTVVKSLHTVDDMTEIGQWLAGAEQYFLQNFVDSGDVLKPGLRGVSQAELEAFASAVRPYVPSVQIRNL